MPCPKCHQESSRNAMTGLCPKCQAEWDHIEAIFYARFLRGEYIIGTVQAVQADTMPMMDEFLDENGAFQSIE